MEIFSVKNLSFTYKGADIPTLKNISFTVNSGDFITLCGPTGSGKSTLLRLMKNELMPNGKKNGEVLFCGKNIEEMTVSESAYIGFVLQSPEHQTVTDKVWHEVAFGLENLHMSNGVIRRRVAEIMSYFGIEDLFDKKTSELSGGQKQAVCLAGVMAMQPKVIILDEPTSQLDPIAASDFIATLRKLNEEQGLTVIITEHRLENAIPISDKLGVIDSGKLVAFNSPPAVCAAISANQKLFALMPAAARIYSMTGKKGKCPLSVKEGKTYVTEYFNNVGTLNKTAEYVHSKNIALKVKDLRFRYSKDSPDILRDTALTVYENEALCILGGNGSGKTTFLNTVAGLLKAYYGKIEIFGKKISSYKGQSLYKNMISFLPQDVGTVFLRNTLEEEFEDSGAKWDTIPYDLSYAAKIHPYDLSGGEQQLAALAKVLAAKPKILLLDEPTKGLDTCAKMLISDVLKKLKQSGLTVIAVTHDVEFAAMFADRCAMFFRGEITEIDTPSEFFALNSFYTTPANTIMRNIDSKIITCEEASMLLNGQ